MLLVFFFFFQAEDGIRDGHVTGVQTCALPIYDATFATDQQGDQCPESWGEGDCAGQRETGRGRRRPADALWECERTGERRHCVCPGEECRRRRMVEGRWEVALGNA